MGLNPEFLWLRLKHRIKTTEMHVGGMCPGEEAEFLLFTFTCCVFSVLGTEVTRGMCRENSPGLPSTTPGQGVI